MPVYIHKRFRRLAFYFSDTPTTLPFRQVLLVPLTNAYSTLLRGPSFAGIHSINLYLFSNSVERERVEKVVVGFLDYYTRVDLEALTQLATDRKRQHYMLTVLQQAVRHIIQHEGWEGNRFEQAYYTCLQQDLPVVVSY
jgi:hypothetical protein